MSEAAKKVSDDEVIQETAEIVEGPPNTITLSTGVVVTAHKCKVRQIGTVLSFLSFLFKKLNVESAEGLQDLSADFKNPTVLMELVGDSLERVIDIIQLFCDLDKDAVEDLDIDDCIALALKEWEVNETFFTQRVLPLVRGLRANAEA